VVYDGIITNKSLNKGCGVVFISLWGFMGAGKSTIGKAIAAQYHLQHIDSDVQIEQEQQMAIHKIFELHGENHFRDLETRYLQRLLREQTEQKEGAQNKLLLTTGGGMPVKEENRELLKRLGKSIYIHVPFNDIVQRLKADTQRPLWDNEQMEAMKDRYETRLPLYRTADFTIITKQKTLNEIVEETAVLINKFYK
jgi:shikimate kinase